MTRFSSLLIVLVVLILAPTKFAISATSIKDFTLTYKNQTFPAGHSVFNLWRGKQIIKTNKAFKTPNLINSNLLAFIGQPTKAISFDEIYDYRLAPIYKYVAENAQKINTAAIEPVLKIQNGSVIEFVPPKTGVKINNYKTALEILTTLQLNKNSLEMSAYESEPLAPLSSTNNLGINELIAEGESNFSGSPNNRRHNINIGINKFKGLIIQRGDEFSFNKYLGEVDKENGFLPELVIKKEGTVLELGGGLCQVSSTVFRTVMNGGMPITQRRNHAYAVQYYSPQGTDATIYPGVVDFKFINDTPGAILIWPYLKDKNTLVFDFYGSKDSRQVTLQKPVQYDKKPDGSMKAVWTRVVTKDGETSTTTFKSVYQSPALFHKTEEFPTSPTGAPVLAPPVVTQ